MICYHTSILLSDWLTIFPDPNHIAKLQPAGSWGHDRQLETSDFLVNQVYLYI